MKSKGTKIVQCSKVNVGDIGDSVKLNRSIRPKITIQDLCPGDMLIAPVKILRNRTCVDVQFYVTLSCVKSQGYEYTAVTVIEIKECKDDRYIVDGYMRLKLLIKNRMVPFTWSSNYAITAPIFRLT